MYGANKEEHDQRLEKVLQTLKANDVTLNSGKCDFGASDLHFLGHHLSANGITPEKVSAIKEFRAPKNAEEVRSFLGLLNIIGKFIPDLATVTDPLRQLTRKSVPFE